MAKNKGLGRGLKALITDDFDFDTTQNAKEPLVFELEISKIRPNIDQPRRTFNKTALEELSLSIQEHGLLQPILVQAEDRGYTIIAGERRWRAANLAGLKVVPVIVKDMSPRDVMEIALIENVQREDLNPIEEALAYQRLMEAYDLTQGEIGIRIGKNRTTITNILRLLQLPKKVQNYVLDGMLSNGHARALLSLKDENEIEALSEEIIEKSLSVRDVEQRVKNQKIDNKEQPLKKEKNPYIRDVEERLATRLNTMVKIKGNEKKGNILLSYTSLEELNHIIELMEGIKK